MRSFASDNNSGVHPLVMDAVIKANDGCRIQEVRLPDVAAHERSVSRFRNGIAFFCF